MPLYRAITREQVTERLQAFVKANFTSIRAAGEYFGYVGNDTFYGYYYGKRPTPPFILRHLGMDLAYVVPVYQRSLITELVDSGKLLTLVQDLMEMPRHADRQTVLLELKRRVLRGELAPENQLETSNEKKHP